ncbi:MAG TPA: hypothetical protein VL981_08270 [Candidatus Methylacidiphilales bacterium]|nr:hypothetical protein [Candidatus Methylacidiphilales bacterium]
MTFQRGETAYNHGSVNKISMLPPRLRNEINRRLDEHESPREIAAWLNGQGEVRKILNERWDGKPLHIDSIKRWRQGHYKEWVKKREHLEKLKELSEYALKLGEAAGGSSVDGSAAILGGRIMTMIESASGEEMLKMARVISDLRAGDLDKAKLKQADRKLAQTDEKLDLERKKFQRETCALFLQWYDDKKAREIVESSGGNAEKIEQLGRAIFGEDW